MTGRSDDSHHIERRLDEAGRSKAELARYLGLDPSSLTKTIRGKRGLKASELLKIEEFFAGAPTGEIVSFSPPRVARDPVGRIPIYGYAAAGDRVSINEGQVVEWIEPPPFLVTGGEFFGVRVIGTSMEPRYFAGEVAVAQRGLPPAKDRDCIVEFNNGAGVLKAYKAERDGTVFCHQWNPDVELRYPGIEVRALHSVVWRR